MGRLTLIALCASTMVAGSVSAAPSNLGTIAFHSLRDGASRLYSMRADGRRQARLVPGVEGVQEPAWSRNGTRLAFIRYDTAAGIQGIVIGRPGSPSFRWLTRNVLRNPPTLDESPQWSVDGRRILFARTNELEKRSEMLVVDTTRGGIRRIGVGSNPAWSPDGRRIAFALRTAGGELDLYVARADGRGRRRVTSFPGDEIQPDWSPNGKRIAFVANRDGNNEIYVMNADGTKQRRLTFVDGFDLAPDFSPDGRRIAFASKRAAAGLDIYVMSADGRRQTRLTTASGDDNDPAWRPARG